MQAHSGCRRRDLARRRERRLLRLHAGGSVVHTGQVFFSEAIADAVYRRGAYRSHGEPDTTHARDSIYGQAGGSRAVVRLSRRRKRRGYVGAIALNVRG